MGDYDAEIENGRKTVVRSLRAATFEFGEDVQSRWRADVQGSGLASAGKVARTIRLNKYPNENRNGGMSPAVLVYTNWPRVMAAFERGSVIRSRRGKFVLVPNPEVWPGGRVRSARRHHRDDADGSAELKAAERRFGPLRFVPARTGKPAMLVADVRFSQKTGRFSRLSHAARTALDDRSFHVAGAATIVVFWLATETRQKKRLRGAQIRERARRAAPNAVDRLFKRNMNYGGGDGG